MNALKSRIKSKDMNGAQYLFDKMNSKDVMAYNTIMQGYNQNGMYNKTIQLFESNEMNKIKDTVSCNIGIQAYSKINDIQNCQKVFHAVADKDKIIYGTMMKAYLNHKMYQNVINMFWSHEMNKFKDNVCCNIAIQAYSGLKDIDHCQKIFNGIKNKDPSVFGTIMQAYNNNDMYDEAVKLYLSIKEQKFKNNIICNIAIQAYSKLNDIYNCEKVFSGIKNKNNLIYNCMIQAYNDNEMYHKAIELFVSPEMEKFKDNISCATVIQSYSKLNDIDNCEHVFNSVRNKNVILYNCMMQAYNDNEMYGDAVQLFSSHEMRRIRDNISCHIAINGYSKLNDIYMCEQIFGNIVDKNVISYNSIMQAYNDNKMYAKCIDLFESDTIRDIKNNISCNIAIQAYSKLNDIRNCQKIFKYVEPKSDSTYGSIMQAYMDNHMYHEIIQLYLKSSINAHKNNIISSILIQAYSKLNEIDNCETIFNNTIHKNDFVYNGMMQAYFDHKMYQNVIELFESKQMEKIKNNISCHIAMQAYSKSNDISNCEVIFDSITNKDDAIYNGMMQAYSDNKMYRKCIQLFSSNEMKKFKNNISCHIAIEAYSHVNDLINCETIFNSIENKDTISYSVMMNAYRLNNEFETLLNMFDHVWKVKRYLDSPIFCNALHSCGHIISWDKAIKIIHKLNSKHNRHLLIDGNILGSIIAVHSKCSDNIEETRGIYDVIVNKANMNQDIIHSAMMDCYAKSGDIQNVITLFDDIRTKSESIPDHIYSIILNSCSHAGYMDKAIEIFHEYLDKNNGIVSTTYVLNPIIDGFGRCNQLNDAELYYNKHSHHIRYYKDKIVMLKSILSSCRLHNDIDRAKRIVTMIEDLCHKNADTPDASIYTLLSNMYTINGRYNIESH